MSRSDRLPEREWQMLLHSLEERRSAFAAIEPETNPDERRRAGREWWEVVSRVLHEFARSAAIGDPLTPMPTNLFASLSGFSAHLAVGDLPDPMSAVLGKGRRRAGPRESQAISYATAYFRLVYADQIEDKTPVKTIQDAYGVERQTAQRWKEHDLSEQAAWLMETPTELVRVMREAGENYRRAGRSSVAYRTRGT